MSASRSPLQLPFAAATGRDQIERLSKHASPCRYLILTR